MVSVAVKEPLKETGDARATHATASRPLPTATSEPAIRGRCRRSQVARKESYNQTTVAGADQNSDACGKKVLLVEHVGSPAYLGGLSELAGRSFGSAEEAREAVLRLLSEQLGMRSAFLTRITPEENRNEVVASHNAPGGCGISAGALLPLSGTF